jgi:GTP cyclohydrolase I
VPLDEARLRAAVEDLLAALGEDPSRPELAATPARVAATYAELFSGVGIDAAALLAEDAMPAPQPVPEIVALRGIAFRSVCEHHLLPFTGQAAVAYLPGERLAGLGRIARAVDVLASRPQLQERLTEQLASAVEEGLAARGVLVVVSAAHGCLWARGTRTAGANVITLASRGMLTDPARRAETVALLGTAPGIPDE